MPTPTARERLIIALDQTDPNAAFQFVDELGDAVAFYKVGWVSILNGGVSLVEHILAAGKNVFLDLKIFDVPRTVGEAVRRVADLGVKFATVHGNRENIEAALEGRGSSGLQLLAVTVLTSLSESDVRQLYSLPEDRSLADHVMAVTKRLVDLGCDGVIASPQEISRIRGVFPDKVLVVTPGIRMADDSTHDHKRPGHPYDSIKAGADYLVVGRSIYTSDDPRARVEQFVAEIERGLADR